MRRIASAGLSIALLAGAAPARAGELSLSIDAPADGSELGDRLGLALVRGSVAEADRGLDLLLAIDVSHSTAAREVAPRGWRRWLAWLLPRREAQESAGALSAEMARALERLAQLDPARDRAGVIALGGDVDPRTPDAWVAAPLGDPAAARHALDALRARGSRGTTNLIEALELARVELTGGSGARRVLLLLTDGVDVHPLHPDPAEARALLASAAARVCASGIELEAWAPAGGPALDGIAEAGGRVFAGAALPALRGGAELVELGVLNTRSGAGATASRLSGARFEALVPLSPGANVLEIRARTRSGLELRRALELSWDPRSAPARDPELLRARTELLAAQLRALRARRGAARSLEIEAADSAH